MTFPYRHKTDRRFIINRRYSAVITLYDPRQKSVRQKVAHYLCEQKTTIVEHFVSAFSNGEQHRLELILDRNRCLNI